MLQTIKNTSVLVTRRRAHNKIRNIIPIVAIRPRVIPANIRHRRKIHVHANFLQLLPSKIGVGARVVRIARTANFCLRRRRRQRMLHPRNPAAFLVQRDKQRNFFCRRPIQIRRKFFYLLAAFHVPVEKNHAANVVLRQHKTAVSVNRRAVHAYHHHLPNFFRQRHVLQHFFNRVDSRFLNFNIFRRGRAAPAYHQRQQYQPKKFQSQACHRPCQISPHYSRNFPDLL